MGSARTKEAFLKRLRGIPARHIAAVMTSRVPGVVYSGPKERLAEWWAQGTAFGIESQEALQTLTLDTIYEEAKARHERYGK